MFDARNAADTSIAFRAIRFASIDYWFLLHLIRQRLFDYLHYSRFHSHTLAFIISTPLSLLYSRPLYILLIYHFVSRYAYTRYSHQYATGRYYAYLSSIASFPFPIFNTIGDAWYYRAAHIIKAKLFSATQISLLLLNYHYLSLEPLTACLFTAIDSASS